MALVNPLDVLFRDIKKELYLQELAQQKAKQQGRVHVPKRLSTYANPQNWTLGKTIELMHFEEGSLGKFNEYFHKLSPSARRLLPAAADAVAITSETVFGEFWLHPKFSAPMTDSEVELQAIEARFHELLALEDEQD